MTKQTKHKSKNKKGLCCDEYNEARRQLDGFIMEGFTHGMRYTGGVFRYCPFCGKKDFDRIGLKSHLTNGDCETFNNTENIERLFGGK